MDDSTEYDQQTSHSVQLENINKDSIYAIFVSCIEIYNNMVYDLLEHTLDYGKSKLPQRKLVREDSAHNMYVHDAVEVEVKSSKEACKIFYKGMHRKHTTFTSLNSDSNRSHSVFTIRVVQAVLNRSGGAPEQKQAFCVSQLCLVDLAGSKRTSHTKKTGQRLMESGIINNSLMTLKSCFKTLQENQMLGTKKLVSYRDSKLTYLFKNFFEGESCVHALVCVNPKAADFDENMQVMKLAESVKEVQVLHPSSAVRNLGFPVGRKRANHILQAALQKLEQDNQEHSSEEISSLSSTFPCLEMKDPMDDKLINELVVLLEHRNEQYRLLRQDWVHEEKEFRNQLEEVMRTNVLVVQESTRLRDIRDFQKNKRLTLEAKVNEMCLCVQRLQQELHSKNKAINMVKLELEEKKRQLCYLILENKQTAHICVAKLPAETHTGACNIQVPLSKQEDKVKITAKEKTKSHTKVKHALMDDIHYTSSSSERNLSHTEHKSAEVVMHANINELQNAELSGVASLHSVQHHAQALTTEPSGKTLKANVVTVAQNGMENLSKYSAFTSLPRRRSIASPVTLAEDKSNTSVVA